MTDHLLWIGAVLAYAAIDFWYTERKMNKKIAEFKAEDAERRLRGCCPVCLAAGREPCDAGMHS